MAPKIAWVHAICQFLDCRKIGVLQSPQPWLPKINTQIKWLDQLYLRKYKELKKKELLIYVNNWGEVLCQRFGTMTFNFYEIMRIELTMCSTKYDFSHTFTNRCIGDSTSFARALIWLWTKSRRKSCITPSYFPRMK